MNRGRYSDGAAGRSQYVPQPNDDADLPKPSIITVLEAGDVSIIATNDSEPVVWEIENVPFVIPVIAQRLLSTGTTSTKFVAIVP